MERLALPEVPGVEHRFVEVSGVRLHVAESGSGTPLLLLHGWPQHWWCWRHLIPRLAETYRVIAPDLRGFGWSDAPQGDYEKAGFASDIAALIESEELGRVRVLGHDWGGFSAFLLALERPDLVERLLALDISPPWMQSRRPSLRQLGLPVFVSYQVLLSTPGVGERALTRSPRFVRSLIKGGSGPDAQWSDSELNMYASVLREPARAAATAALYRTFLTRELPAMVRGGDREPELTVPAKLVMGERSPVHRTVHPEPQPGLEVDVIPRAGHFLAEEAPDRVLEIAEPWFA